MIPHEVSAPRVSAFPRSACGGTAPPPSTTTATGIYLRQPRLRVVKLNCKIMLVVLGLNQRFLTLSPQKPSLAGPRGYARNHTLKIHLTHTM